MCTLMLIPSSHQIKVNSLHDWNITEADLSKVLFPHLQSTEEYQCAETQRWKNKREKKNVSKECPADVMLTIWTDHTLLYVLWSVTQTKVVQTVKMPHVHC